MSGHQQHAHTAGIAIGAGGATTLLYLGSADLKHDLARVGTGLCVGALVAIVAALVWSRTFDPPSRRPAVVFRRTRADALEWGPGLAAPIEVLDRIDGQPLTQRLMLAVQDFALSTNGYAPYDGVGAADSHGVPFVARVWRISDDEGRDRRLIIVRAAGRSSEQRESPAALRPRCTRPSMLAAVAVYEKEHHGGTIDIDEVHALDARYLAECVLWGWSHLAEERGLPADALATASLADAGILWKVTLQVPITPAQALDIYQPLDLLLRDLRVPIDVRFECGRFPAAGPSEEG